VSSAPAWQTLAASLAGGPGGALALGPGTWHVLFGSRRRSLLVPAGELPAQRRCLRHFVAGRLPRLAADVLLWLNSLALFPVLPELRLARARKRAATMLEAPVAAIQIGTPSPYRKASALLMSDGGRPFALAKIALAREADAAVESEAGWLRALAQVPELAPQVPRLLEEGTTPGGRRYVVTSLAPGFETTSAFTPAHAQFLAALGHVRLRVDDFEISDCGRFLHEGLARLEPVLERGESAALARAIAECEAALVYWSGPYVAAQGDFAPWNIRALDGRVFVFDWECGQAYANPLEDVLHYLLIGRAVRGQPLARRHLVRAMRRAQSFACEAYPPWSWRPRVVSGLALAYLLSVILRYSLSEGRLPRAHPVIRSYWRLMERRESWMAD
jgi:hypothetical protein